MIKKVLVFIGKPFYLFFSFSVLGITTSMVQIIEVLKKTQSKRTKSIFLNLVHS